MKYKIIANPAAGKGKARKLIPQVEQLLRANQLDFDLVYTERPWHASSLAFTAVSEGYDVVAAAGGDGTCNEVINGIMQAHEQGLGRACMGVIAIGRGNDFAFGAGMPTGWMEGCRALVKGVRRTIDVGRVTGDCDAWKGTRYFGNGIGIGFDAVVNVHASRSRLGGFLGYVVAALRTLFGSFHSPLIRITTDQEVVTQPSLMVSIMNGRRMGGGFLMTPESACDDGLLDVCLAHEVGRATILIMIPRFLRGTQAGHPAVRFLRSRMITVTAINGELPMQVDGETVCLEAHHLTVEALAGSLEVLCLDKA